MSAPASYPLAWPLGWPRAKRRHPASFRDKSNGKLAAVPLSVACRRLQDQLDSLRARDVTLSTNLETRVDGQPRGDRAEPFDGGAALYFKLNGRDTVLACDKWDRVADNIVALAKHIEAIRGQERWGVGTVMQAFAGYQALFPPPPWHETLECRPDASREEIHAAYLKQARAKHPDTGGDRHLWDRLQNAYEEAKASIC